jgi:hypothetical protein
MAVQVNEIHKCFLYKNNRPMNIQIQDKNVLSVMARFKERSEAGMKKYKTTLERTDLSTLEWLQHAQEEAMDFVLYLERLKHEYKLNK